MPIHPAALVAVPPLSVGGAPVTLEYHGLTFALRVRPDTDSNATHAVGVTCALLALDGTQVTNEYDTALWGIDASDGIYITTVARELVEQLAARYPTTETVEHRVRRAPRATGSSPVFAAPVPPPEGWAVVDTTPGEAGLRDVWWIDLPRAPGEATADRLLVVTVDGEMESFVRALGGRLADIASVKSTQVDYVLPRDSDALCDAMIRARRIATITDQQLVCAAFRLYDNEDCTVPATDASVERGEDGAWVEAVVYVAYDRVLPEDKA